MTQYLLDPSQWATETAWPSSTGRWTTANHTTTVTVDRSGPFKDRIARISLTSTSRFARTFDAIDSDANRATFDFSFPFRIGASGDEPRAFARASGAAGSEQAVLFGVVSGQLTIGEYRNPTYSGALGTSAYSLTAGTWYRMRCYGNGTQLYAKIWLESEAEPSSWTVGATATITAAGWIGLGAFNGSTSGNVDYGFVAASTNGDAPLTPRTRTQWMAWLEQDAAPRCVLAELGMMDTATPVTKYLSNVPYSSKSYDSPASQPYTEAIVGVPSYRAQATNLFAGQSTLAIGELILDNADGSRDAWLKANVDGRDARILLGAPDWPRYDFRTFALGTIRAIHTDGLGRLSVQLRDRQMLANKPVQTETISGGDTEGRLVPLTVGAAFWLDPVPTNDSAIEYQVHDGAVSSIGDAWDNAVRLRAIVNVSSIDTGTDVITTSTNHGAVTGWECYVSGSVLPGGLAADTPYYVRSGYTSNTLTLATTPGGSAVNITSSGTSVVLTLRGRQAYTSTGKVVLATLPAGELRIDQVYGLSDTASGMAKCVDYLLKQRLSLTGYIDDASITAHDAAHGSACGVYLTERANALDVFDRLFQNYPTMYGFDRNGLFYCVALTETVSSARLTITSDMIRGGMNLDEVLMPVKSYRLLAVENANPSTQFASSVAGAVRAKYAGTHQSIYADTNSDGTDSPANHALAYESRDYFQSFYTPVASDYGYFGRKAAVWSFDMTLSGIDLRLGDIVSIVYPRYGFTSGLGAQVIATADNLDRQTVRVTVIVPNYSQAAAP